MKGLIILDNTKVLEQVRFWKNELLDLKKSNQMINFKEYKSSTIKIIYPKLEDLFKLFGKKNIVFADLFEKVDDEVLEELDEDDDESDNKKESFIIVDGYKIQKKDLYNENELYPIIKSFQEKKKNSSKYLYTNASKSRQNNALRTLIKKSKVFREENSINILHLAIGFLNWYESTDSDVKLRAPLILVPIELKQAVFDGPVEINFDESELLLNATLLKKMELDYGFDFGFEFDENEDEFNNTSNYFTHIESMFIDKRWYIDQDAHIGLFSFNKINMVKDIEDNEDEIIENPIIQALSGLITEFDEEGSQIDPDQIDQYMHPDDFYQVLDADSSQEYAIQTALTGKSFVLQGPPGTGKSQTITNIISELIARGKKVLFVAEKKAALDVVYNNLRKAGINQYALPLHNINVDKKELIKELSKELESRQQYVVADEFTVNDIKTNYEVSKEKLNNLGVALLKKRMPLNKSIYQIYGDFLKLKDVSELNFRIQNIENMNMKILQEIKIEIENIESIIKDFKGNIKNNVWFGFNRISMSLNEKDDFKQLLNNIKKLTQEFADWNEETTGFKIKEKFMLEDLDNYLVFLALLSEKPMIEVGFFDLINIEREIKILHKLDSVYKEIKNLESKILKDYRKEIFDIDIINASNVMSKENSFIKRLFSKDFKQLTNMFKALNIHSKSNYKIMKLVIADIKEYNRLIESYHSISVDAWNMESHKLSNHLIVTERIKKYEWFLKFNKLLYTNSILYDETFDKAKFAELEFNYLKDILNIYIPHFEQLKELLKELQNFYYIKTINLSNMSIDEIRLFVEKKLDSFSMIELMLRFNHSIETSKEKGLESFIQQIIETNYDENLYHIYLKRFYSTLIDSIENEDHIIKEFRANIYDNYKETFKLADKKIINLVKIKLDEIASKNTPNYNGLEGQNFEVITLRREANKSRKLLPLRVLFDKISNLIMTLKPCLMMSPLSVSSYLKSKDFKFDAVIFDEASQIRPESAIGAIFRSTQIIVVGDKEQLPPTNFFDTASEDTDEDTEYDAYKSILEVSDSVLKSVSLKWHYRSKFEELIRISNREIYENLITFPSKIKPDEYEGVTFKYVQNGIYYRKEKDGTKKDKPYGKNIVEAQYVVNEIIQHICKYPDRSLGIVALSISQANAIESELFKVRRKSQEFEWFFSSEKEEPFFIKSIETVQGDERDTIMLSIGHGKDENGKMLMNFGPINKDGGYRRLNVAITRAKINTILVSSIKHHDIDLSKTNSKGVYLLKTYLEYAEFGEDEKVDSFIDRPESDSPFEEDVYNEIIRLGYNAQKQVGSSGYKIDIAVTKPNNHKHYVLGIECDGAAYHSTRTARDRDRLRQDILESRGWKIYRVWSTDWFRNRQLEIEKLEKEIKKYIGSDLINLNEQTKKQSKFDIPTRINKKFEVKDDFSIYPDYKKLEMYYAEITDVHNMNSRLAAIIEIIKRLSPIHIDELKKIVSVLYGRQKYNKIVDKLFSYDLVQLKRYVNVKFDGKYFIDYSLPVVFRKYNEYTSSKRDFLNIHNKEIESGIFGILDISKSMMYSDLQSKILEYCGYKRLTEPIKSKFDHIFNDLVKENRILILDEIVTTIK